MIYRRKKATKPVGEFHLNNPYTNADGMQITLKPSIIKQAYDIAKYDTKAAIRYIELITSKEYLERPYYKSSKRVLKSYDENERKKILYRLMNRSPFNHACPVCGDEQVKDGYCCRTCQCVANELVKQFKAGKYNIDKLNAV